MEMVMDTAVMVMVAKVMAATDMVLMGNMVLMRADMKVNMKESMKNPIVRIDRAWVVLV